MTTIYDRIKEASDKRKMSIDSVNDRAGLSNKAIYGWKKSTPKADNLQKVADVLNVSTDYLLGRTDRMNLSSTDSQKEVDIKDALEHDIMLAFDGKPISDKYKRIILELLSEEDD
ncbi:helix-turn-helix transcriptional regulator [Leuconostoc gelidum subsp. gasicomitatum]|uniref:helix-turn-helix domain-containing protein n=1 Tax=Leuconostoc gasicomitatum TaxID=115778 RepID=UPI0007449F00|nr:helix-turn-helix transcriptional regulator [Leuconostoc gasicomitatum]MBZ5952880.1 helix-turn-helix transcriptional regulator [Leuconostoc gasicomitatum]CUR63425.1 CI phage repressor protein [Leuconostoc gasicomitatum KG16-1]